jgi:hypothetical protein
MTTFILQITPEGGEAGTKIIKADSMDTFNNSIVFYVQDKMVAAFSQYEVCVEKSFILNGGMEDFKESPDV